MLYIIESSKSFERVTTDLTQAVDHNKFDVLGVHDLHDALAKKSVAFTGRCRMFEVCQPHQAKRVLEEHPEVATVLPARLLVYVEGGRTKLAMLRPTVMTTVFGTPALESVAAELEAALERIMAEAARP